MRQINCYIPIKLSITGRLSDTQLDQLSETLVRTLTARIAFAELTIASRNGGRSLRGDFELVQEEYDPAREDVAAEGYFAPSYNDQGQTRSVPMRRRAGSRRWRVQKAITIRLQVRKFVEYLEGLDRHNPSAAEIRALYPERLDEMHPAAVWLVVANQMIVTETLVEEVAQRIAEFVTAGKKFYYAYTHLEANRRRLLALDEERKLAELPDMSYNPGYVTPEGQVVLGRGGMLLFVEMALAEVAEIGTLIYGEELTVSLPLRALDFIVNGESFKRLFSTPWGNYLTEFGDQPALLRMLPVFPMRRVHLQTLKYLTEQTVASTVDEHSAYFGNLYLLNQSRLDWLPVPARDQARSITDSVTLALDESRREGIWEPDWSGAFIYAVVSPSEEQLNIARLRPEARRLTPLLLAKLQGDPRDFDWRWGLLHFLENNFGSRPSETRPAGGTVFEFVLAELERLGAFNTLFDKVESSGHFALQHLLLRLSLATYYVTHERVRRLHERLSARVLSNRRNIYRAQEREIWLDRDPDETVRVGQVLGDVDSIYIFERDAQRLKPSRMPAFREALQNEREALIGRILRGEDTNQYTEESFAKAIIAAAAQRIHLSKDDFEEITIQRSMRLLRVEARMQEALPRYYVTFEFVERVEGERWQSVSGQITEIDDDFEARLIYWRLGRAGEFYEAVGIGISVVGLIAVAWEAGIIAALVKAAGGATVVLISIGISELLYILRVVFGDAKLTLRGFLEAALDGYLMALGFRGAGILGRAAARVIGTESLKRIVGGWVAERLIVGTVGGAGTAALTTFSHDLINVASGRGGWSGIDTYVRNMTWGALLGTVFEFGIGALQPILRAGGETALQTLGEVVQRVRAEGFTAVRWTVLTTEALGNLHARLSVVIGDVAAHGFVRAMGERLVQVAEQLGAEYRLAVFRRVLELSPGALSHPAVEGLERFLSLSRGDLTNEAALALLNRLNPAQLRSFLEALNTLDSPLISALARAGQLETLAGAAQLAGVIRSDPVIADLILQAASVPSSGAARVRDILAIARNLPPLPESIERGSVVFRRRLPSGEEKPIIFEVVGRPDLYTKVGGGRSPVEARAMIELEMMGIETVYASTRRIGGQTNIVIKQIDGVGSKDIIGRPSTPLRPPRHTEMVTQRTIDDLERIYRILQERRANIGDFQFIVRRLDGAVFVNDPTGFITGSAPSGNIRNIIDRFRRILRNKQSGGGE